MKIGIDASRYKHAEATGVEWYSWHIINGLVEEIANSKEDELILYSKIPLNIEEKNVVNKLLAAKRLWTLRCLSKEMWQNPPDVLFVPSHTLPLNLPKKSVITIHDVAFRHLKNVYSFSEYHHLNWSTKMAVKNGTKIIVPSQATKDDLIKFFACKPEKVVVIPHGFEKPKDVNEEEVMNNSDIFKYFGINKETKYALFVGRLENKKNLVKLVEAFAKFSENNPDYQLILAGKRGLGFEKILKTVNKFKLADKVIMPGYITEEEKAVLYMNSKFFVFPSLYEGFGLPLLEAFYYGKAVLCSNNSSLPEVGGEAAHYINPQSAEEIAEGLEKLANDETYVNDLVKKGSERLKLFNWKEAVKKTLWTIRE